ncbi:MAG TPA: PilZ domain-containing protein [Kofleriaceae bacterium]|nr:PilZ domain-containing protein [Kofleriaceae bacterium]
MSVVAVMASENTRRHARVSVNLAAVVEQTDGDRPAMLADVGEGGAAISAVEAPEVGAAVIVRFRLLRLGCEATGRVAWRNLDGDLPVFGVAFEGANPQMATFLRNLAAMPARLRALYLLDVADPRVRIA